MLGGGVHPPLVEKLRGHSRGTSQAGSPVEQVRHLGTLGLLWHQISACISAGPVSAACLCAQRVASLRPLGPGPRGQSRRL